MIVLEMITDDSQPIEDVKNILARQANERTYL